VTTTGRLLAYAEARRALRVRTERGSGKARVYLEADALPDGREIDTADLAGISLRGADPSAVEVMWRGELLPVERVPGDDRTVWVPWRPLIFPEPPGAHA
jgi:hypothetical protein